MPVHPWARSLCNIEAVIGQLYPATLLARLVTLELPTITVAPVLSCRPVAEFCAAAPQANRSKLGPCCPLVQ
ncbi:MULTISPECIES: hypothetical protein [Bradyrhizobium]|uniref:Uncharacterized protein n=1 Tax=Bradyrhizobium barranii subsp. barranii TaxID=2823807 RepID=A0A9X9YCQ7_9BRAD|nr:MULTISPECIES: hypothetical protein [Bradyrhizobium]UEM17701.1 hypothetical protein J4G43_040355 [Bradyrhizobium barranii subsp. barranii]